MKEKSLIKYDMEDIEKAFSFINIYNILEIDSKNLYHFSNKEKHILKRIKNIYSKLELLSDSKETKLKHIDEQDVLKNANSFLIDLFPKYKDEILYLDNLIIFGDYSIYDAGVSFNLNKDKILLKEILIPADNTNYVSSIIVHEKTHALTLNNIKPRHIYENNSELFSIFLQKLFLIEFDDPTAILLDRIIRINDTKESFNHLELSKYLLNNYNSTELDKQLSIYFKLLGYNYLLSEFYSYLLILRYLENKELVIKNLNQVLDKKLSISDFLSNHQITLTNEKLIPTIKEETNKCKRITIIP